ncbi:HU family DNA-binding protein [uncultured Bacteroides sp.]|uniref:HU family DNA-binding protein n=1 Tax=uncultured Bacteroides sp. TaxID=162156 RepID=UPI002AAABFF1|nr:HU family DNA-binding protein [uncultured Bacteroides sp.]
MSILYQMNQINDNTNADEKKKRGLRPTVLSRANYNINDLADYLSSGSPVKKGEIMSAITQIASGIENLLKDGNTVTIDNFGTFSLTATSRLVENASGIRAESIHINKVVFQATRVAKKRIESAEFERFDPKRMNKRK